MEENKVATDSSAPNSPELTRLSGEQAEERTAREIRKLAMQAADTIRSRYIGANPQSVRDEIKAEVAEMIEAVFLPECSRLASRVEELEEDLRVTEFNLRAYELGYNALKERVKELQNGAGAHAEEKE